MNFILKSKISFQNNFPFMIKNFITKKNRLYNFVQPLTYFGQTVGRKPTKDNK